MVRPSYCDKLNNARKGSWTSEEKEATNFEYISKHGSASWSSIPKKIGQKKCGKNCRSKWNSNYLRPDVSHEGFTQQEDELIIKLHAAVGTRWGLIAHQLPGRTENDIKIHWNTKLRKKLTEMGIDPITHKPFSQILADYGSIGGLSRTCDTPKYIGTIRKDLKKTHTFTLSKPQSSTSHAYTFLSNSQVTQSMSPMQNNYANHSNNSHSLNLLSQLQAITLVTKGPNSRTISEEPLSEANMLTNYYSNCDFFELASPKSPSISSASACSSNYTNNNAGQSIKSPDCCSWHDYLLEDAFKPAQNPGLEQEQNNMAELMSISTLGNGRNISCNETQAANAPSATTSDGSSFLEAMLDQENDVLFSFPGLMDEPLY